MKSIINNTYLIKDINIDMFEVWQEVLKAKDKIVKSVKKINGKKLVQRLVQFFRTYKTAILTAFVSVVLWVACLMIFIIIV